MLCTDLDRTVVPNGREPESPEARPRFRRLATRPEVTLVYVTGRHAALIRKAIEEYALPVPDYAIADVGATIYEIADGGWRTWEPWTGEIQADWKGLEHDGLAALLADIRGLRVQEPEKQGRFKLSYYAAPDTNRDPLLQTVQRRLRSKEVEAALIWSIDEMANVGLLDVLPARATKAHAIEFLRESNQVRASRTVFAGDSGNDLPALTSGLQAVLVKNARDEVREEARRIVESRGIADRLYLATGGFHLMNGNYAAGVLEGVAHFHPETEAWMGFVPTRDPTDGPS
jgi:HAD superfamily hydrolase (TIGR01484 family)